MPPVSPSRFSVSVYSMNFTPLIHVVIFGGLFSMRARSSFHLDLSQNLGQSAAVTGHLNPPSACLLGTTISVTSLPKSKLRTCGLPPMPSPYTPIRLPPLW